MNDHPLGVNQKFWEDDILRELGKICVSFPDKCVKCFPNASVAYRVLGAPRYSRDYGQKLQVSNYLQVFKI